MKYWSLPRVEHNLVVQGLHQELLAAKAVVFDAKHLSQYQDHFLTILDTFKDQKTEKIRASGMKLLRPYLELFYAQVLQPLKDDYKAQEVILKETTFMTKITDEILKNLSDYHDSVRDEALGLLVSMMERFLPPQIALD